MTKNLTNLSLVAILGLGACAGQREEYRPFYLFSKDEVKRDSSSTTPSTKPNGSLFSYNQTNSSSPQSAGFGNNIYDFNQRNRDLEVQLNPQNYFDSYAKDLPAELVDDSTSVDLGFARVAASGDSVLLRPIYSPAYRISLDNDLTFQKYKGNSRQEMSSFYFENQDSFNGLDDDPERIRREEGVAISSLLRWIWDWDVLRPLKNTADEVKAYSNEVVRDTLGPNSDFDYTGRRIVLGYNIPIGNFYLECDLWAEVADLDQNGLIIHMTLPIGARRN